MRMLLRSALTLAAALPGLAGQDQVLVLRGALVLTGTGAEHVGGTVILHQGKIVAVGGNDLVFPAGARVLDLAGRTITPGLVDAGASIGVRDNDRNEQGDEVTPQLSILDAVDPTDPGFVRARATGVTAVRLCPGNRNAIGGLGAVLKTAGDTVAAMLVKERVGLNLNVGREPSDGNRAIRGGAPVGMYYRRPTTRMGVIWEVRRSFYQAMEYRDERTEGNDTPHDAGLDVLVEALAGKLDVHTTARAEQDIRTALRLAGEFGYKTVLEEVTEAYRCVDLLAASKVTCLIGAPSAEAVVGSGASDGARMRWHTLGLLAQAGVPFAIQTGSNVGSKALIHEAVFAVRNGLDRSAALAAVTATPAKILGVADRLGSLVAGRDADVVVWSGDPFDPASVALHVFIAGAEVQP